MTDDEIKTYTAVTEEIQVSATPLFIEEESNVEEGRFLWAYQIRIENQSDKALTLRSRHWRIMDATGHVQEISGEGVIGEQPLLLPGDVYEYTSAAPLPTPSGLMQGLYVMTDQSGRELAVTIPTFSLDSPYQARSVH